MKQLVSLTTLLFLFSFAMKAQVTVTGSLKKWHKITLSFQGPWGSEGSTPNPFLDYRLQVTFSNGDRTYIVPGYFAADGQAGETSATSGNIWRVHFAPDTIGEWLWEASFCRGNAVAISTEPNPGTLVSFHGLKGSFEVTPSDKSGTDLRAKGRLKYIGERYLLFSETGQYFLKAGPDSPENFLAYDGFDNTPNNGGFRKSWSPHIRDWEQGDPVWKADKGRGIIGALNYLSRVGQNVFSFLTFNVNGDDRNVFPHLSDQPSDRLRMDCSKLDQWEIVFEHADHMGLYLHFKLQEQENDQLLDGGFLGVQRKLYYRELVARFGHHLALNWNIGEENTNTAVQRLDFAAYIRDLDPYDHPIVVHSFPDFEDEFYTPILGPNTGYTGVSLQQDWKRIHSRTLRWIQRSEVSGHPWVVANDEQGPADLGVPNDEETLGFQTQDNIRKKVLWGNLMAGGGGVEYYFGYDLPESDLTAEDFRSRSKMWAYNRIALSFFEDYLPFWDMQSQDTLLQPEDRPFRNNYCFADTGRIYVVYLSEGGNHTLILQDSSQLYELEWFNPRTGGQLIPGYTLAGGDTVSLGFPPTDIAKDWVALIRATDFDFDPLAVKLKNPGWQQLEIGEAVSVPLVPFGGTGEFSFGASGLPDGITLDTATGRLEGVIDPKEWKEDTLSYSTLAWVIDHGDANRADTVSFTWLVSLFVGCPRAGTPCDDGYPLTVNDQEDGACNCLGDTIVFQELEIWQEVECSKVGSNWVEANDKFASNQNYLIPGSSTGALEPPSEQTSDIIQIQFDIPLTGFYKLFARTLTRRATENAIWLRFNGGSWMLWDSINHNRYQFEYQWDQARVITAGDSIPKEAFVLEKGQNVLEIAPRKPGIRLDKLLLSPGDPEPEGLGGFAAQCLIGRDQPEASIELWEEVECGTIGDSWEIQFDTTASQGSFVQPNFGEERRENPPLESKDLIQIEVEAPFSGFYQFYHRSLSLPGGSGSFWFRVNNGPWLIGYGSNNGRQTKAFEWNTALANAYSSDPAIFLNEGVNQLEIGLREPGLQLDKILLSSHIPTIEHKGSGSSTCRLIQSWEIHDPTTVSLFPSPAKSRFTLEGKWEGTGPPSPNSHIYLYDGLGRIVDGKTLPIEDFFRIQWDISRFQPGIYWVRIGDLQKKLIIQR